MLHMSQDRLSALMEEESFHKIKALLVLKKEVFRLNKKNFAYYLELFFISTYDA